MNRIQQLRTGRRHLWTCIALAAVVVLATGVRRRTDWDVVVSSVDFKPVDGRYDLNWPGPPRRAWTESDKEYYDATVKLEGNAPGKFALTFAIKADRTAWPDPELGAVTVTVPAGSSTGTARFWLVCTKKGKVKGSTGKDNDSHADVYLEKPSVAQTFGQAISWEYTADRKKHVVRCK